MNILLLNDVLNKKFYSRTNLKLFLVNFNGYNSSDNDELKSMIINTDLLSKPSSFSDLPNEVVLIIWMYLDHVEAIKIFRTMKCRRYTRLLEEYCYKKINFRNTSLSNFQYFCSHLLHQIRLNIKTLQLGHRTSYSQLRIFTQICSVASLPLPEMFPNLKKLVLYNVPEVDDDLEPYLTLIPCLQDLMLRRCSLKKASFSICTNLLGHGRTSRLRTCILHSKSRMDGIILPEPIPSFYQVQEFLIHLQLHINDLDSLKNLLHFLPKLSTLNVRICTRVPRNASELFVSWICPCIHLTKLTFRTREIVEYFPGVANFILLFRNSLLSLDLDFIYIDPAYHDSLVYMDGNLLFSELTGHMTKLENLNFAVETVCICDQQMEYIIKSFQTQYWLSMLVGCYYDKLNSAYIIFSLPYAFPDFIVINTDIVYIQFNQTGYQLMDLVPMFFAKMHRVCIHIGGSEKLTSSFLTLLKQRTNRGHRVRIRPHGSYQMEEHEINQIPFNQFQLIPCATDHRSEEHIGTTMTWLNWMPHLQSLCIDAQMLSKFVQTINLNGTINRFSSLEKLIVRQLDRAMDDDTLAVIARLGVSSSIKDVRVEQYKVFNTQSINYNNFRLNICEICCNMQKLETMTVDFANPNVLSDSMIMEEFAGTEKKNCQIECIYISHRFIQFWLEK